MLSLFEEVAPLAEVFQRANRKLYLVGGVVRDMFARPQAIVPQGADIDLTTDALPDEVEAILRGWADSVWLQGKRFGTVGASKAGRQFEVTTHRAEVYQNDSRKPEVLYSTNVEEDLARRDFTVNSMALTLPDPKLIDPFNGVRDLAEGRLRTPLSAEISFGEDPLRMLRAARFMAGFSLVPDDPIVEAVSSMHGRLAIVSPERIRDELDKLLVVEDPSPGLWFIVQSGLAEEFLPELPSLALEQDPVHHHKDVLAHTIAVVAKTRPERIVRLAALLHDIGKPKTRSFGPEGVSFHHHDVVGARMARERMRALRYGEDDVKAVSSLVELHLRFHTYRLGWSDKAVRRYVRDAGGDLERLNELTRCDCTTRNAAKARALSRRMDELEIRIEQLRQQEEIDAIKPDLDGRQVMEILGVSPGPQVGKALDYLLDIRLDEGPLAQDVAKQRLLDWHRSSPK